MLVGDPPALGKEEEGSPSRIKRWRLFGSTLSSSRLAWTCATFLVLVEATVTLCFSTHWDSGNATNADTKTINHGIWATRDRYYQQSPQQTRQKVPHILKQRLNDSVVGWQVIHMKHHVGAALSFWKGTRLHHLRDDLSCMDIICGHLNSASDKGWRLNHVWSISHLCGSAVAFKLKAGKSPGFSASSRPGELYRQFFLERIGLQVWFTPDPTNMPSCVTTAKAPRVEGWSTSVVFPLVVETHDPLKSISSIFFFPTSAWRLWCNSWSFNIAFRPSSGAELAVTTVTHWPLDRAT